MIGLILFIYICRRTDSNTIVSKLNFFNRIFDVLKALISRWKHPSMDPILPPHQTRSIYLLWKNECKVQDRLASFFRLCIHFVRSSTVCPAGNICFKVEWFHLWYNMVMIGDLTPKSLLIPIGVRYLHCFIVKRL